MDAVGTYAIEGTNGKIFVLLFNKDTVAREAEHSEEGIKLNLPARSATLLVWNK